MKMGAEPRGTTMKQVPATDQGGQIRDRHDGPGWLAASGLACLIGRHWPAAALVAGGAGHRVSICADCGRPMVRSADNGWIAQPFPAWSEPRPRIADVSLRRS
ncbi:hypothetical protein [Sphingomonas profundi]|uniref:hypothetical protein n=1 Tax=Alterirhizorhabdus profundi TaxID=2681549 RepID=UPI0012E89D41|nr:hypothetical protein [Sphingomonas profundi]